MKSADPVWIRARRVIRAWRVGATPENMPLVGAELLHGMWGFCIPWSVLTSLWEQGFLHRGVILLIPRGKCYTCIEQLSSAQQRGARSSQLREDHS